MLDSYPQAIRADLAQFYGYDLADMVRARRWRKILADIDALPAASRTTHAIMTDPANGEALALAQLENQNNPDPWTPTFSDWTLTNQLLTQLLDQVRALGSIVIAANGGKPGELKPSPRPVSAAAQALEKSKTEAGDELFSRM